MSISSTFKEIDNWGHGLSLYGIVTELVIRREYGTKVNVSIVFIVGNSSMEAELSCLKSDYDVYLSELNSNNLAVMIRGEHATFGTFKTKEA